MTCLAWVAPLALVCALAGCKKKDASDPAERGKLARIAERLEEAYAQKPLPPLTEPPSFAERISKWDDFRACTVRTYVARKRRADELARDGERAPSRHASIGEAAVEECAVQSAVVNKDPSMCERLTNDFQAPTGGMPLAAVRCWDTRARALGKPEECPVVWLGDDLPGRNPECLALAHRDPSFCPFSDDPLRCRAIVAEDPASCVGAAPDCAAAVAYWADLVPAALGPPHIELKPKPGEQPIGATVDIRFPGKERPTMRVEAPQSALGLSWPAGKAQVGWTEDTTQFWGGTVPAEAAQLTWRAGKPAVKIAFVPSGAASGVRPVRPPGPTAPATVMLVWPEPRAFLRCVAGPETTGELRFDAASLKPGGTVTGKLEAEKLTCSDGTSANVSATFKMVVLDLR